MRRSWILTWAVAGLGACAGTAPQTITDPGGQVDDSPAVVDPEPEGPVEDPTTGPNDDILQVEESDAQSPLHAPLTTRPALAVQGTPTESGMILVASVSRFVLGVDADNEALQIFDVNSRQTREVPVGAEPTRMVRAGDTVWVTLRGSGELVRLDWIEGELVETDRVVVGAEPYDVVLSPDASRLYVSLSQEDTVVALDATMLVEVGRWVVGGEPRWLTVASKADGEHVYVASARRPTVRDLRPDTGTLSTLALPVLQRFSDPDCVNRDLRSRITGDMSYDPERSVLYVPTLYADTQLAEHPDNILPAEIFFRQQEMNGLPGMPRMETEFCDESTVTDAVDADGTMPNGDQPSGGYGDPISGDPGKIGRFTPAVVGFDDDGVPTPYAMGTLLGVDPNATTDVVFDLPNSPGGSSSIFGMPSLVGRSYVSSVRVGLAGDLWATMPGAQGLVRMVLDLPAEEFVGDQLQTRARIGTLVTHDVRDAALSGDRIVTWAPQSRQMIGFELAAFEQVDPVMMFPVEAQPNPVQAPASHFPADLARGRELFTTAADGAMAASGSGVSCETCHADFGSDGFTWVFDDFARQTPTLAGNVSATAPITWTGEVATVVEEVHLTTRNRMGGAGPSDEDAAKVAAFIDQTRLPIRPEPGEALAAAIARGAEIYERADVGCATCHSGTAFTDGRQWRVAGFSVATNTPSLKGIAASAPYLHDGSARSLRELLLRVRDGSMGNTSSLTDDELIDLEAYLRSL